MIDTVKRVKWKNIFGLLMLILVVFAVISLMSVINLIVYGDCVERGDLRVCFEVDETTIGRQEATEIKTETTNTGKSITDAVVTMSVSPNLEALSNKTQDIEAMAPSDTVERKFRVAAQNEVGEFVVEFDIDSDLKTDKKIWLTVE
jgi:urease accessory protein UreF